MIITDELREWARDNTVQGEVLTTHPVQHPVHGTLESLVAIADRIDEAHESSYKDGYDEGAADILAFCDRLKEAAQEREDVALWGVDYVALPVDADGEPIHVGDVVIAQLPFGGESKPLVVDRMELSRGRDGDLWCVALDTDEGCWNQPSMLRHHRPPTVEDILREFALRAIRESEGNYGDLDETCAEYAKRLRLAGEDE